MKANVNIRAHFEKSRGTSADNKKYCSKDGDFVEFGEVPSAGSRSDLKSLYNLVKIGKSFGDIYEETEGAAIRHESVINKMIAIKENKEFWEKVKNDGIHSIPMKEVEFYWGPTGTGKTSTAIAENPGAHINHRCRWFDGYCGEDCVIFDEYIEAAYPIGILLRLTDKYPMRVEVKGGFVNWTPKKIIFTTNESPDLWFATASQAHRDAMTRRISKIKEFK